MAGAPSGAGRPFTQLLAQACKWLVAHPRPESGGKGLWRGQRGLWAAGAGPDLALSGASPALFPAAALGSWPWASCSSVGEAGGDRALDGTCEAQPTIEKLLLGATKVQDGRLQGGGRASVPGLCW